MKSVILYVVVVIVSFVSAAFAIRHYATVNSQNLQASPPSVNIGRIPAGTVETSTITIKNVSRFPVVITKVVGSCGCTTARMANVIPPKSSVPMTVTFNSAGKYGEISKLVYVFVAGSQSVFAVPVVGHTYRDVIAMPSSISLGNIKVGGEASGTTVVARVGHDVRILDAKASRGRVVASELKNGQSSLRIDYPAGNEAGEISAYVDVTTDSPIMPRMRIPVYGSVIGDYHVDPPDVNFGVVPPGIKQTKTVSIEGVNVNHIRTVRAPANTDVTLQTDSRKANIKVTYNVPKTSNDRVENEVIKLATGDSRQPYINIRMLAAVQSN